MIDLGDVMRILELQWQGLSVPAIAARLGMDRKTVRKYIRGGVQAPRYVPRAPRPCVIDPFVSYVTERVHAFPELSVERLLREMKAMGYPGSRTALGDLVREVRPPRQRGFEVRFETPAVQQAQVDFAHFNVEFDATRPASGAQSGCSRSCWATAGIFGVGSSNIRICRRYCAVTWKRLRISVACRARFSVTGWRGLDRVRPCTSSVRLETANRTSA
jgi:hypothetical protein